MDDLAEQHAALMRATGGAPPLRRGPEPPRSMEPAPVLVVPANLPREVVEQLSRQWSAALEDPDGGAIVSVPMGATIVYPAPDLAGLAAELVRILATIEDDEGRAIWLTASEVELDQWLARVTSTRDALSDHLASKEE